jgi:predicted ABC-type transport system involved in lysophospholipase L1 biosynthesis ATPase subunit
LSLRENVLLPALAWPDALDLGGEDLEGRAERLLHRVGLAERAAAPPSRLSGGERQRAAMVRALMLRPALLLCDEPTGSLDRRTAQEVAELLMEVNREEAATLVVVTHSAELARLCARRSEMVAGRLSA